MVRCATLSDIPVLVPLTKLFYDEMSFDDFGNHFDPQVVWENYASIVQSPDKFVCLVAERGTAIVGVILFVLQDRMLTFRGHRFGQEVEWHSHPELSNFTRAGIMVELLIEAEKQLQGIPFYISSDVRFASVGRFLEKRGYRKMSQSWYKGV